MPTPILQQLLYSRRDAPSPTSTKSVHAPKLPRARPVTVPLLAPLALVAPLGSAWLAARPATPYSVRLANSASRMTSAHSTCAVTVSASGWRAQLVAPAAATRSATRAWLVHIDAYSRRTRSIAMICRPRESMGQSVSPTMTAIQGNAA